ncbi:MAG: ATP-binding protein [bacterium]|nr:ATP-binding protein [bacterium]
MTKIRDALLAQKKELDAFRQKTYVPRDIRLTALEKDISKVIIGPRRAGKSFLAIHELKASGNFGYANFDDEYLVTVDDYNDIIETINTLYNNPEFLFLDEVQNLPKWELFVNRLQRQGYNLVITGSNSNLLSKELATHLTGRHISTIVFPFTFKEYLRYFDVEGIFTSSEIKVKLENYLLNGGFPEPLVKGIDYGEYLRTLHDSIVYKDIVKRYNIKAPRPLVDLSTYLMSNPGNPVSYRTLMKLTGMKTTQTVAKYLDYLAESFLHFKVDAFSLKYKEQVKSNKKIYAIDNGLIAAVAFRFTANTGVLYENMVAVELKRRQLKRELEFFYYKNSQGYEVDFVVKKGLEVTCLLQVCYDVSNPKTKAREVRALLHGRRNLGCENLVIITGDYDDTETVEWYGIKGTIRFIPLWKWLLESED